MEVTGGCRSSCFSPGTDCGQVAVCTWDPVCISTSPYSYWTDGVVASSVFLFETWLHMQRMWAWRGKQVRRCFSLWLWHQLEEGSAVCTCQLWEWLRWAMLKYINNTEGRDKNFCVLCCYIWVIPILTSVTSVCLKHTLAKGIQSTWWHQGIENPL